MDTLRLVPNDQGGSARTAGAVSPYRSGHQEKGRTHGRLNVGQGSTPRTWREALSGLRF